MKASSVLSQCVPGEWTTDITTIDGSAIIRLNAKDLARVLKDLEIAQRTREIGKKHYYKKVKGDATKRGKATDPVLIRYLNPSNLEEIEDHVKVLAYTDLVKQRKTRTSPASTSSEDEEEQMIVIQKKTKSK